MKICLTVSMFTPMLTPMVVVGELAEAGPCPKLLIPKTTLNHFANDDNGSIANFLDICC